MLAFVFLKWQVQIFSSFEMLNSSSNLNLEIGSVAFVLDTSVMYILTEEGWKSALVEYSLVCTCILALLCVCVCVL